MKQNSTNTDITINDDGFSIGGGSLTGRTISITGGDILLTGSTGEYEYTFQSKSGTIAHLDDIVGSSSSGTSGINGTSGTSGETGTSGTSGEGSPGTSGTSGETGTSGTSGEGSPGTSGTSGAGGGDISLSGLTDVVITDIQEYDGLIYSGSTWVNTPYGSTVFVSSSEPLNPRINDIWIKI